MKLLAKRETLYLALITLAAGLFRFYKLDFHSLWSDELTIWADTQIHPFSAMLKYLTQEELSPPAYWILQYPFTLFLVQSEFGVRFLVALLGTLSVPALYFTSREIYSKGVSLLAAILLAVSFQGIYFSQEARAYSLMIFLTIVSTGFWLRLMRNRETAKGSLAWLPLLGYIISASVLMYTHIYGLLLVGAQGLLYLTQIRNRHALKECAIAGVALTVLYLPWVPVILSQMKPISVWFGPPEWMDIFSYHKFLFDRSSAYAIVATLLIIIYFIKNRRHLRYELLLLGLGVIPFAIAFWRSRVASPMLFDRYMLIALPSTILLTARATLALSEYFEDTPANARIRRWLSLTFATLFVGICLHSTIIRNSYYTEQQKDQNREASLVSIEIRDKYKTKMFVVGKSEPIVSYYFHRQSADTSKNIYLRYDYKDADLAKLISELPSDHFVYLSYSMHIAPSSRQWLEQHYKLVEEKLIPRSNHILVFKKN